MTVRRWEVRLLVLLLCGLSVAWASPQLTTIQDVLYKADGTPFNGFLLIDWNSFQAADSSNIAMQSLAVPIINGVLRVQLVPTTNASDPNASYTVRYVSDGKIQFQETWSVPPSTLPLRLQDVRVAGGTTSGSVVTPPPAETAEQESDITGLVADLAARPVKGAAYGANRTAYIDAAGALEAVVGNLTDCVRVDGSASPCAAGGSGPTFVDGATPAGALDGLNVLFTLPDTPSPLSSLSVYRNGLLQAVGIDYTASANTITFNAGSIPQPGDTLTAGYRLMDSGNPVGQAGGALTGTYPNPMLALAVVSDANVADLAGIAESKLALNYPTHSNANDPSMDQKAALAGTASVPSGSNRYVTDQDSRLADQRTPVPHGLLSASHSDTTAAAPVRGDLIVGQGASPTLWARLPLGTANRCLTSNGSDAVWGTCLYTGFAAGAVPFIDANGNLAQSNSQLLWDNTNRKLSIGNSAGAATVYIWDALPGTGSTALAVRAGQGQGTNPLQIWLDSSGNTLAQLNAQGGLAAASFHGASSGTQAAWQDAGSVSDPSSRTDGDTWYNTTAQAQKTSETGQAHPSVKVLCSSTGTATSSTALTQLGTCTIPANFLKVGDRVDIRFDYSHEGTSTGFTFEVHWGGTMLISRAASATESVATGRADAGVHGSGAQWNVETWGATLAPAFSAGNASDSVAAPITVSILGKMAAVTTDTVTLRNFTVLRYPAQQNP